VCVCGGWVGEGARGEGSNADDEIYWGQVEEGAEQQGSEPEWYIQTR